MQPATLDDGAIASMALKCPPKAHRRASKASGRKRLHNSIVFAGYGWLRTLSHTSCNGYTEATTSTRFFVLRITKKKSFPAISEKEYKNEENGQNTANLTDVPVASCTAMKNAQSERCPRRLAISLSPRVIMCTVHSFRIPCVSRTMRQHL
jgi:hypothetical protein